jgi:acyl-CoA ligase (AMP-forming) (exosortase A-associated)
MHRLLHEILADAAAQVPGKIAAFIKAETMTYGEFGATSRSLGGFLAAQGLRKGDRVGFFLEKRFEKITAIFGISMAGCVFVPIRRLSHGPQVEHILNDSGSRVLITTYSRFSVLAEHADRFKSLELIIGIGNPADAAGATLPASIRISDWSQALAFPDAALPLRITGTDLAAILYTSGSTGAPKGVVLSHHNLVAGAYSVSEFLRIGPEDRLLSILTFGFDYGLNQLITAFLKQAQIVLLDYLFPKDIINIAGRMQVTGIAAVATTWIQLAQIPWKREDMPALRYITNSGGAIPERFVRELRARLPGSQVFLMYGLTEAFRSTFLDPDLVDQFPTSIGKAIPGEEILILDENRKPVAPGGTGELVHRGELVAQGYWNAPELTQIRYQRNPLQPAEVPVPEMVVFSGDQVRIEANGLLYFVGRKDEMIKCAGNRMSPTEVEDLLYASGLVKDAMALGVPHEIYGQTVIAVIVASVEGGYTPGALRDYCKKAMPPYMIPTEFDVREDLPRNANGKLDRSAIKQDVHSRLGIASK